MGLKIIGRWDLREEWSVMDEEWGDGDSEDFFRWWRYFMLETVFKERKRHALYIAEIGLNHNGAVITSKQHDDAGQPERTRNFFGNIWNPG